MILFSLYKFNRSLILVALVACAFVLELQSSECEAFKEQSASKDSNTKGGDNASLYVAPPATSSAKSSSTADQEYIESMIVWSEDLFANPFEGFMQLSGKWIIEFVNGPLSCIVHFLGGLIKGLCSGEHPTFDGSDKGIVSELVRFFAEVLRMCVFRSNRPAIPTHSAACFEFDLWGSGSVVTLASL